MSWLLRNSDRIFTLLFQHLWVTLLPVVVAIVIAIPIGYLAYKKPRIGRPLLSTAALMYAIPALPLLIVVPLIFGTELRSNLTLMIALTIYAVALMVRTVEDAFTAIQPQIKQAAQAVGHSSSSTFWKIELPLAGPQIFEGIRVISVSTISLVTIGALIGLPSLGSLLTDGFQRGIVPSVIAGILLTMALALVLDTLIRFLSYLLFPWVRKTKHAKLQLAAEVNR